MVADWYQRFGMAHCLSLMAEQQTFTPQMETAVVSETMETVYQITRVISTLIFTLNTAKSSILHYCFFFSLVPQPNSGLCRLVVEVSRSNTLLNTHTRCGTSVGAISSLQRPLPTHSKRKRRLSAVLSGNRTRNPCNQSVANLTLDLMATGISSPNGTFRDLLHAEKV